MSNALQCPYCELKFATESDRRQHIAFDHPGKDQPEDR